MPKKLLLVAINARYTHSNLAIRYLRNYITDLQYNTDLFEFTINQKVSDILWQLSEQKADIIAFSVYIWNSEIVKLLLNEIKKIQPEMKLVLGGPEVSYNADQWLKNFPAIDWIVQGAGESAFAELLKNNLQTNQKILFNQNPEFDCIPFPYMNEDFPKLQKKYLYYESSRGCPFKCSYCLSSRLDQKLENRSRQKVEGELKWLIERKPRIIKFVDRTFNVDKQFARHIWKFLIDLQPKTTFHFEIHAGLLEEEDFNLLGSAPKDLFQFEIGIQSINPETISVINRQQNWLSLRQKILRLIGLHKFHIHVDMIAGLPFENLDSLQISFNEIIALGADHFQLGFLKVLPGTEMAENCKRYEIQHHETAPYEILSNKWLSFKEIHNLHLIEKLVNYIYNSGKFNATYRITSGFHNNPFDFFYELVEYAIHKGDYEFQSGWENTARLLLEYVSKLQKDLILDSLRWDWCQLAGSHYYPVFLRNDLASSWKRIGRNMMEGLIADNQYNLNRHNFSREQINKTIYLKVETKRFRQKMSLSHQFYAFIPHRKRKYILPLE